jgi:hypothetical protein
MKWREAGLASLKYYSSGICIKGLNNAMKIRTACVRADIPTGHIQNTSQKRYVIKTTMLMQSK